MKMTSVIPNSRIVTYAKIQNLLRHIDRQRQAAAAAAEPGAPEPFDNAGLTCVSSDGPLTVLCEANSEVCYFHGGLIFLTSNEDFNRFANGPNPTEYGRPSPSRRDRKLSVMEVEFVLGIASVLDPLAYWVILGSDLVLFVDRYKKKLKKWTVEILSLLLTQRLLKKHAGDFYRKVSALLTEGAWSKLSEAVPTNDAFIARFAGHLLGTYGSMEAMEKALDARWHTSLNILHSLAFLVNMSPKDGLTADKLQGRADMLWGSFKKLGVHLTKNEVEAFFREIELQPHEIKKAIEILGKAFDSKNPYQDSVIYPEADSR
ncbi:MAG TPA: hypothetical protein PK250_07060 [Syntrophobacter fumaroxidans]|nr:hypothetical protein [Syntrophobacter fumaroxidans]